MTVPDKSYYTVHDKYVKLPDGATVESATLTVKASYEDADGAALFTVQGEVISESGPAIVEYTITPNHTDMCEVGTEYVTAIKLFMTGGAYYTPLEGHESFTVVKGGIDGLTFGSVQIIP